MHEDRSTINMLPEARSRDSELCFADRWTVYCEAAGSHRLLGLFSPLDGRTREVI